MQPSIILLLFNIDVYLLRTEHRIVGNLIGCLPTLPRQDELLGLPLTLMEEEVFFLISRKVARVVEFLELEEPPGINVKSERELLVTQNLHFKFYQQFLR